jgi:hypothetical protein
MEDFINCCIDPLFPMGDYLDGIRLARRNKRYQLARDLITGATFDKDNNLIIAMKIAPGVEKFRGWLLKNSVLDVSVCYVQGYTKVYFEGTFNAESISVDMPSTIVIKLASYGDMDIRHESDEEERSYYEQI